MGRALDLLKHGPRLIVSLPANDAELAAAAREGGADILKVHMRVTHAASGTRFGTLEEERLRLKHILGAFSGPVGIVAGAEDPATSDEMDDLRLMGIDFFDLYTSHMPAWMWRVEGMNKVVALEANAAPAQASMLERLGADAIEAAVIPHEGYGQPLTVADLLYYRAIRESTNLPIIVPSQRKFRPDEALLLTERCGVEGIMIGAIVTGRTPQEIERATKAFKRALGG
jgi:hypothetical protein